MSTIIRKWIGCAFCALKSFVQPKTSVFALGLWMASLIVLLPPGLLMAQQAIDEEAPWPRVRSTNGNTVTIYLPQAESWTSNWFKARAVVDVQTAKPKKELLGVVWFEAHGHVDHSTRIVTLDDLQITKGSFPETTDNGSNALALVRELFPGGARTVSLDYLVTALGFAQAAARSGTQGIKNTPPEILWLTNRTALVILDGPPVFRPISGSSLERVINTPALLVRDPASGKFYLSGEGEWFAADSISGPWTLVQLAPAEVVALSSGQTNAPPPNLGESPPKIIISTQPAESLATSGLPDFRPIRGTSLQYVADSANQLFYDSKERSAYLLLSGRWYTSKSLNGPWAYVSPQDLPADFAKIPPGSPQAIVLASVPGTRQSELAMVANSVPTTATVSRHDAKIELTYDGEPKFKPIEGTDMSYAVNAQSPVVQLDTNYYALDDAVWFVASSPTGPWQVAEEVPQDIYTIPPSSPVYYATFARVYDADTNTVDVGYTPGYTGTYEDQGTVVYGTGYDYEPWYGDTYYGWGWTWGYSYCYVPWYSTWLWRPWWNDPYGLRAAVIDNIYDRWGNRNGVTPHDRVAGESGRSLARQNYPGYPALYGRFTGATGRQRMQPPADTLALNPYSRPKTAVSAGNIPKGAQLLSSVRQSPGGGRDLYASPDGNVYMRKNDGWYQRGTGGKWNYFSPSQGQIERTGTAGRGSAGGGDAYRIAAAQNVAAARGQWAGANRPNIGGETRLQDVANLDRAYYARALGQMREQNMRPAYNNAGRGAGRPVRGGGRRR